MYKDSQRVPNGTQAESQSSVAQDKKKDLRGHKSIKRGNRCLAPGRKLKKEWRCLKGDSMSFITRNVTQAFFLQGNIHTPQVHLEWSHRVRNEMVRTALNWMLVEHQDGGRGPAKPGSQRPGALAGRGTVTLRDVVQGKAALWLTSSHWAGWQDDTLCASFGYTDQSKLVPPSLPTWKFPAASHLSCPQPPV